MVHRRRVRHGLLCVPILTGATFLAIAGAATGAPGEPLPLQPARTIAFETDQGTWLSAAVAPDGRTILFDLLGDLYRMDSAGGEATRITQGMAFDSQPAWSPDGAHIAFLSDRSGAENVWIMRADGSDARQLTDNDGPNEFVSPAWSADGTALFVSLYRSDRNAIELWQYDVEDGTPEELSRRPSRPGRGRVPQVRGQLRDERGSNALGASPSPDGRYVYYARRGGPAFEDDVRLPLWTIDRRELASGRTETIVADQGSAMRPVLSPDGSLLAYAVRKDGRTGLRVRDLATGADRLLAFPIQHDAQESLPTRDLVPGYAFTPDGAAIVLTRDGGFARIDVATGASQAIAFRARVELALGPQLRQEIVEPNGPVRARLIQEPRQSPDGKRLAFSALGRIYVMSLRAGATPRRLTRADGPPEFQPAWSPDGRSLAYVSWTAADGGAIWLADASTGRTRRVTRPPAFYSDVVFAPDGTHLMALRSSAHDRRHTIQEPQWTGRSGGFLRQAELVEVALAGGAGRVLASGLMSGAPQFANDREDIYLNTDAGLEAIRRDGSGRSLKLRATGLPYYFMHGPAPVSDIKLSPDGRHALILHTQQLYLVALDGKDGKDDAREPIDLTVPSARVQRLTRVGADFSAWSQDGQTITWALGSTFFRRSLAATGVAPDAYDARVELPRDTPTGTWVLRGATLVTMRGDEVIANADLVVRDNRIAALGPSGAVGLPHGAHVIDAAGQYVVPGYIDAHMHIGGVRRNVLEFDDWGVRAALAYGVTSALDPSSLSIDLFAYEDMVDAGLMTGPRLYTTGTAMFSFNHLVSLDDARDLLRRYRDFYRTRNVKQYRIGSRRARQWVAMAAGELGVMPTCEGALDMKLGLTQVLDGFAGNEHSLGVYPLYRDVVELLARSQTSSVLTLMISHGGPPAGADFVAREAAIDDDRIARLFPPHVRERAFARVPWVTPRDYVYGPMARDAAAIQRAGGVVGIGSHGNYPGIGTHWEMRAHAAGGMTPHEILRAATLGSATTIGRAAELGSLEPGKLADFVVLSANPLDDIGNAVSIRLVVKDGRVYEAETLDEVWPRQRTAGRPWWVESPAGTGRGDALR